MGTIMFFTRFRELFKMDENFFKSYLTVQADMNSALRIFNDGKIDVS